MHDGGIYFFDHQGFTELTSIIAQKDLDRVGFSGFYSEDDSSRISPRAH